VYETTTGSADHHSDSYSGRVLWWLATTIGAKPLQKVTVLHTAAQYVQRVLDEYMYRFAFGLIKASQCQCLITPSSGPEQTSRAYPQSLSCATTVAAGERGDGGESSVGSGGVSRGEVQGEWL